MKDQDKTLSQIRIRLEQVTKGIIPSKDVFDRYWESIRSELLTQPEKLENVLKISFLKEI